MKKSLEWKQILTHLHVSFVVMLQINKLVMVITKFSFNLGITFNDVKKNDFIEVNLLVPSTSL